MKIACLVFLALFISCNNQIHLITKDGGSRSEFESMDMSLSPDEILPGQQSSVNLSFDSTRLADKSIYYQVVDQNGDVVYSGSSVILEGQNSAEIDLAEVTNFVVSEDKVFTFQISVSSSGPFAKVSDIKIVGSPVVKITTPTVADVANSLNFTNQIVKGTCNKSGAAIALTGDVGGTVSGTCDGANFQIAGVEITGADGIRSITATILDEYGNTASDTSGVYKLIALLTAVLSGLPNGGDEDLSVTVGGALVSSYRYKFGDNSLDCSSSSGYSASTLVSVPITDAIGGDGPKKLCVIGIDNVGNTQSYADATEYAWIKTSFVPALSITSPSSGGFINLANQASFKLAGGCEVSGNSVVISENSTTLATVNCDASLEWSTTLDLTSLSEGANTLVVTHMSSTENLSLTKDTLPPDVGWLDPAQDSCFINSGNLLVKGSCEGTQNVVISSSQLAAPVNATCSSDEFSAGLSILSTGLNDGDAFTVKISQTDSAGNTKEQNRQFKFFAGAPPITFGGWEDVYAIGKKTYKDGNPEEKGIVRIKWKDWPGSNACQPSAVKVFRSNTEGNSLSGTEVSVAGGISSGKTFEDITLTDSDFGKAWYYGLKVMFGSLEVDVPTSEIRVMAPPANMALVHRWITNQEVCGLLGSTPDPDNHYRCAFTGQGNKSGFADMGYDLLVDRFELGWNITKNCGPGRDQTCVSSNFGGMTSPHLLGLEADIGAVYCILESAAQNQCFNKNGPGNTDWVHSYSAFAELGKMTTNEAHTIPVGYVTPGQLNEGCNYQQIDLSHVAPYSDNSLNGLTSKRIMTQKEWRAAAAWDQNMEFPSEYLTVDNWITHLETASFHPDDPNQRKGKCNYGTIDYDIFAYIYPKDFLSAAERDFLGDYYFPELFETGSKIATSQCQSRYGIQDMIGNSAEYVSDEIACGLDPDSCQGVVSSIDGNNTDLVGFKFDGITGPISDVWAIGVVTMPEAEGLPQIDYFNPVLGLPLMGPIDGAVSSNLFQGELFFLGNTPTGNLLLGGSVQPFVLPGRWGSFWSSSSFNSISGGRCALPVK